MKIKKILPLTFTLMLALTSCGDDNDTADNGDNGAQGGGATSKNVNANNTKINKLAGSIEFPKTNDTDGSIIITHQTAQYGVNFSVEWVCSKRAQRWTCYKMYNANSVTNWNRNNWRSGVRWDGQYWEYDPFQEDRLIPEKYRSTLADYKGSGFNRGHICPSADRLCSMEANGQTFYLSNMQPQYYDFNAKLWAKMEDQLRKWNKSTSRDTLYVCKGGTISDYGATKGVLGRTKSGLIVPKYFFMAILCKKGATYKALGFWVEHENVDRSSDNLGKYVVSIGELERLTGIDFFCNLPDQEEQRLQNMAKENILKAWGLNQPGS